MSEENLERIFNTNAAHTFGIDISPLPLPTNTKEREEIAGNRYPFDPYAL